MASSIPRVETGTADSPADQTADDAAPTWRRIERMTVFFHGGISPKFRFDADSVSEGDGDVDGAPLTTAQLREAIKLLHRHPGAPMALQTLLSEPDALARCKTLLRYLGAQRVDPSIDSASGEGSATCYVNPMVISEYVRGLSGHAGGDDARDPQRLQAIARAQVLQESFAIARKATGAAALEAAGWAPAELNRRQQRAIAARSGTAARQPPISMPNAAEYAPGYGQPS